MSWIRRFLKFRQFTFAISLLSPLGKRQGTSLEQTWIHFTQKSTSSKDALCLDWLKLVQWFWSRRWKCEKFTTTMRTTDKLWSEKLTWAFGSGELKSISDLEARRTYRQLHVYRVTVHANCTSTWLICTLYLYIWERVCITSCSFQYCNEKTRNLWETYMPKFILVNNIIFFFPTFYVGKKGVHKIFNFRAWDTCSSVKEEFLVPTHLHWWVQS